MRRYTMRCSMSMWNPYEDLTPRTLTFLSVYVTIVLTHKRHTHNDENAMLMATSLVLVRVSLFLFCFKLMHWLDSIQLGRWSCSIIKLQFRKVEESFVLMRKQQKQLQHSAANVGNFTVFNNISEKVSHFYFCNNFGKSGTIFIILPLLNSEVICGGSLLVN